MWCVPLLSLRSVCSHLGLFSPLSLSFTWLQFVLSVQFLLQVQLLLDRSWLATVRDVSHGTHRVISPSRPSPAFHTASDKSWAWRPGNEASKVFGDGSMLPFITKSFVDSVTSKKNTNHKQNDILALPLPAFGLQPLLEDKVEQAHWYSMTRCVYRAGEWGYSLSLIPRPPLCWWRGLGMRLPSQSHSQSCNMQPDVVANSCKHTCSNSLSSLLHCPVQHLATVSAPWEILRPWLSPWETLGPRLSLQRPWDPGSHFKRPWDPGSLLERPWDPETQDYTSRDPETQDRTSRDPGIQVLTLRDPGTQALTSRDPGTQDLSSRDPKKTTILPSCARVFPC